jgi:hypothetical protein
MIPHVSLERYYPIIPVQDENCEDIRGFSGELLHLVGNANEAQEHIERSPQRREILCLNMQDQRIRPLDPSLRRRAGVHILLQFRKKRPADLICMIGRKPEQGFMVRHRSTS